MKPTGICELNIRKGKVHRDESMENFTGVNGTSFDNVWVVNV